MLPGSPAFRLLDLIADSFSPALTLFVLAVPVIAKRWRGWNAAILFWAAAALGLLFVYGLRALDAHFGLWARAGLDYSTHTAYVVSLATTVICWDRRWWRILCCAVVAYAGLLFVLGFHSPGDIFSSAPLAALWAWGLARVMAGRAKSGVA